GLKDHRRPGGERSPADILITGEHLVSNERPSALYECGPIAGRLLGSLVFEAPGAELNNCRPGHGLIDCNMPSSLVDL
ncbi:hypothetical protein HOY80DRAFT_897358, partial [Tuber brumale]